MNGAYWRGHMTIGGLPSPHSLTGFLRYLKNVSQRWPVSWMAPTYSTGQEMVSVFFAIKCDSHSFNKQKYKTCFTTSKLHTSHPSLVH